MNLDKILLEEDLFPREFAAYEEREYGFLFYDETNKDSYDSNHAIIFREKIAPCGRQENRRSGFMKKPDFVRWR